MDLGEAKKTVKPRKKRKRIGRGEGSGYGKTSGRGMDGARSRSGWSSRNMTGGNIPLWRRLPKVGFTNAPFKKQFAVLNVQQLDFFEDGVEVTPHLLEEKGLIKMKRGTALKILGNGELGKKLTVKAHVFSKSAREKIEASGGSCEIIPAPARPVRNKMATKDLA